MSIRPSASSTSSLGEFPEINHLLASLTPKPTGSLGKLSSDLWSWVVDPDNAPLGTSSPWPTASLVTLDPAAHWHIQDDHLAIEAIAQEDAATLLADLETLGLDQGLSWGWVVSGLLPLSALESAAQLASLRSLRPIYLPSSPTSTLNGDPGAETNGGLVTSQGDRAQQSDQARTLFGVDGTGVTVGILSDSYNNRGGEAVNIASGDLPTGVRVLQDLGAGGTDEGRAMAQIIHDVAPGAGLAFATAFGGQVNFAQNIINLAKPVAEGGAGSRVIVDDVTYLTAPFFQDGIVAQAVDQVAAADVAYFSSAGNRARRSYESVFVPGLVFGDYMLHDFDPGPGVDVYQNITFNGQFRPVIQWDQPFASASTTGAGSQNDLDAFIFLDNDNNGVPDNLWIASLNRNFQGDPFEYLSISGTGTVFLAIGKYNPVGGPDPTLIKYIDFSSNSNTFEYATLSSTVFGHHQAAGGLGVAAADYRKTPAFGVSPAQPQSYTSLGGVPILFDVQGDRLPAPIIRQQPAITAPDGVDTTFFGFDSDGNGFPNFFGTSASAPSAAGVAALLRQAVPSATNEAIYTALQETALDMRTPGYDFLTGHGLIQGDAALAYLLQTQNTAPSAIHLLNPLLTLAENSSIGAGIKIADLTVIDDGRGTYNLTLGGLDASAFFLQGLELYFVGISPNFEVKNQYFVTIDVDDPSVGVTPDVSTDFVLAVEDINEAPFGQTPVADQSVNVGELFTFTLPADTFGDEDGDTLIYSAALADGVTPLPSWLSFDAETLTFQGTPGWDDAGLVSVGVFGNDGYFSAVESFDVAVIAWPGTLEFSAHTYAVQENGTAIQPITLVRQGGSDGIVTVTLTPSYGTATSPEDFDATPMVVEFAHGETVKTVGIPVVDDPLFEGDETLNLVLENPTGGATLGTLTTAVLTLVDNDLSGLTILGTQGNDLLLGTTGNDMLMGLEGGDRLDGRGGADRMVGGLGNDIYVVDNNGDEVIENPGEGTDTVQSSISYTLPNHGENLTLLGTGNINGMGNELNNILVGNNSNNELMGWGGNDRLDGRGGADRMVGGLGNDTYVVDNNGDEVIENPGEGTDTVVIRGAFSYTLTDNVENLILTDINALSGTGNSLNNRLTGNANLNQLNGGAGADILTGGAGADTFVFQWGQSTLQGMDRIMDFTLGEDKIDLLTLGGERLTPVSLTRSPDFSVNKISTIVPSVFADADGLLAGSQPLAPHSAALTWANTALYLIINDGVDGYQSADDWVINLTGMIGTLPDFGAIGTDLFFV